VRLCHALFCVFVRKDRGSGGVKMRVVVGVIKVPVGVNEVFHWRIAQAIQSLFESGPGRRNESIHDEFACESEGISCASPAAEARSNLAAKRYARKALLASMAEPRNISRRDVCFCKKLNFRFF
jgi:hypothetical protein